MRWIGAIVSIAMLAAAIYLFDNLLKTVRFADVVAEFHSLSAAQLAAAVGLTAVSYAVLVSYDLMGLRHIGRSLSFRRVALTSFTSYVFAHNIGFGLISGGSVRYRFYGAAGLSAIEIAVVSLFCGVTFALGIMAMGGAVLVVEPADLVSGVSHLPLWLSRVAGIGLMAAVAVYVLACLTQRRAFDVRGVEFRLPDWRIALGQIAASVVDISVAALAMYAVMPETSSLSVWAVVSAFVLAILAGVISNVPGGLGVVEMAMVLLLPDAPPQSVLAGALAYRVIYYLVPFAFACVLVLGAELRERRHAIGAVGKGIGGVLVRFAPHMSGVLVMVAGIVLLISGVSPGDEKRFGILDTLLPLPLIEASHLLASIAGVSLLVLARGLVRRLDAAYYLAIAALGAGGVFSLMKGLDYEEALIQFAVLGFLAVSRNAFYRRTPLFKFPWTIQWMVLIGVIISAAAWIGFFSYRHVEYSHDLWWTFALDGDAPRFLRAQVVVTVLVLLMAIYILLRPVDPLPAKPAPEDMDTVDGIVRAAPDTEANLAFLGDKRFLFSERKNGFVMYGAQGGSLISMGDPIAPDQGVRAELAWAFRELCDEHDRRTVFYQVSEDNLQIYVDMGLSLQKLGEEAVVMLDDFSLEGPKRRDLRHAHARAMRDGLSFEILEGAALQDALPVLKTVSDAWLFEKSTREKGFSIGAFTPEYICRFPCAVAYAPDAEGTRRIVAFANLWVAGDLSEVSIDMMRHIEDAPYGVMDYLFIEIMLWCRSKGCRAFNLGLAPLSGMTAHALAPVWHRVGAFIFRHGENFYNFDGLRRYKSKFNPEWRAKYIATRGGLNIAIALFDVSTLISGGVRGLVAK